MAWRVKRSASGLSSSGQPAAKQPRPAASSQESSLLVAVAKLTLANTTAIQELQAAAFTTYLGSVEMPGHKASKEAVLAYIQVTKEEGPDHQRGPLHLHAGLAFIEALMENTPEPMLQEEVGKLKKWLQEAGEGGVEAATSLVPIFRIGKTFKKELVKIQVRLEPKEVAQALSSIMKHHGAKRKDGPPPKTELQRIIQRALD